MLESRGGILLFLDTDTELRAGSLDKLSDIFNANSSIAAIGGCGPPDETGQDVQYISGKTYDRYGRSEIIRYRPSDACQEGLYDCDHLEAAFLAVRREHFEHVGGFDPYWGYLGEDRDLCLRLKDAGHRVVASMETRAIHHNLGVDKSDGFRKLFYRKCLQVALKRDGFAGGLRWLATNRGVARSLSPWTLAGELLQHRRITQRRDRNHLATERMDEFYGTQASQSLTDRLPFPVAYPLRSPRTIVLFVNAICNALCDHCFIIHDEMPHQDRRQLSLESVLEMAKSLNASTNLSLTGGEPFLRPDLQEMVLKLMTIQHVQAVSLFSNGSTPKHIEDTCRACASRRRSGCICSSHSMETRPDTTTFARSQTGSRKSWTPARGLSGCGGSR